MSTFSCFNGADISRCRRDERTMRWDPALRRDASMGPTSVDVGGRVPARRRQEGDRRCGRFNGADISRCRREDRAKWKLTRATLQWGRHQSMSEGGASSMGPTSVAIGGRSRRHLRGFNGADISRCRRVRAGKIPADRASKLLQWGRHQSMSEGASCARASNGRRTPSFNGADISRCRRAPRSTCALARAASMGPTSVDVGGADGPRACGPRIARFNGADISRCRRAELVGARPRHGRATPALLQWGRHQSMSEGADPTPADHLGD